MNALLLSGDSIEIDGSEFVEYGFEDGSKIRILVPEQIEIVQNCHLDPDDDMETQYSDSSDEEDVPGFSCTKCGSEQIPLIDGISGAVPAPYAALPNHIEECLGLEPIETEEGTVTTIQYGDPAK